jgi:Resolvase, N terminal domain/Helix-turn-helix domain of resolvase
MEESPARLAHFLVVKILPLPDQGVMLPLTYDRNEIENQGRTTPETRRLGYARVSTYGQTLDASLAEPWADTGTSTGRLMIAVLGGLADVERDLIRTRTAEGRSRAQKRGQRMGRKPKLTEAQQAEARKRRAEGATLAELARSYGVGKSTISRLGP